MLNLNEISPHIRFAMHSKLIGPLCIKMRTIFDYELLFVEDGEFDFTYDGTPYHLVKNDVILIEPGHPHEFNIKKDKFLLQPHFHFDILYDKYSEKIPICFKNISQFTEEEKKMIRSDYFQQCHKKSPKLKISNLPYFQVLFFSIIDEFEKNSPLSILICKEKIIQLLSYIITENYEEYIPPAKENHTTTDMIIIKNYIESNLTQKISLTQIASFFHFNECYLDKKFKKNFGISIKKYYSNLRNQCAKDLLRQNVSITDVTAQLSFSSIYEFSRFFKHHNGMSPSEYKNSFRSK